MVTASFQMGRISKDRYRQIDADEVQIIFDADPIPLPFSQQGQTVDIAWLPPLTGKWLGGPSTIQFDFGSNEYLDVSVPVGTNQFSIKSHDVDGNGSADLMIFSPHFQSVLVLYSQTSSEVPAEAQSDLAGLSFQYYAE